MTGKTIFHGTFTIARVWAVSPMRVFRAWSEPEIKAQWFTGPPGEWVLVRRSIDFRPGGAEVLEGRFAKSGISTLYEARFHMIDPGKRLIYDYDLHHGGNFHSVTLSSLVLEPEASGTRVSYTEQIVFLDGKDGTTDRKFGTASQFERIEGVVLANA